MTRNTTKILASVGALLIGTQARAVECVTTSTGGAIPAAELVVIDADATATATFCDGSAGYTSEVWLDEPSTVYIGTGHLTPYGAEVDLGAFKAGDELIFFIYVHDTGYTYYTGPGSRNPDGMVHAAVTDLGDGAYHVGFEDLEGGGDRDYDDINIVVQTTGIVVTDEDLDDDGILDDDDNCVADPNPGQEDVDGDGVGDVCDTCPHDAAGDTDGDGACDSADNCPDDANADQADADEDGAGDACDVCPDDALDDADGDGACADVDNCADLYNDQTDSDGDGAGDACDTCPYDTEDDADEDGICGDADACPDTVLPEGVPTVALGINRWADVDGDGVFNTVMPKGKGPGRAYTIFDTAGCSCEQIIEAQDLGIGHVKFGCSISAMDDWVALMGL